MQGGVPGGLLAPDMWGVPYGGLLAMGVRPTPLPHLSPLTGSAFGRQHNSAAPSQASRFDVRGGEEDDGQEEEAGYSRHQRGEYQGLPESMDVEDFIETPTVAYRGEERGAGSRAFGGVLRGPLVPPGYSGIDAAEEAQLRRERARGRYAY